MTAAELIQYLVKVVFLVVVVCAAVRLGIRARIKKNAEQANEVKDNKEEE